MFSATSTFDSKTAWPVGLRFSKVLEEGKTRSVELYLLFSTASTNHGKCFELFWTGRHDGTCRIFLEKKRGKKLA